MGPWHANWVLTEPLPTEKTNSHNINLGGVLDDISDAVSFCIAPAWIFYITLSAFSQSGYPATAHRFDCLGLCCTRNCAAGIFYVGQEPYSGVF